MAHVFLLLVTATYFIRPADWYPPLAALPVYEWLIVPCIILSLGRLAGQFSFDGLARRPISLCVLGLLAVASLSELLNPSGNSTRLLSVELGKTLIFYFLLLSLIDSHAHLKRYLGWLSIILGAGSLLVVLAFHGIIESGASTSFQMSGDVRRAQFLGDASFDPNDWAVLLVLSYGPAAAFLLDKSQRFRLFWLFPLAISLYCLSLTGSRSGLLTLVSAVMAYSLGRWGWRRGGLVGLAVASFVFTAYAGRMTALGEAIVQGTGQGRIQLWLSALSLLREYPLLGVGPENFEEFVGLASHNAFLQAFAELGFVGGSLFLGAFAYGITTLYRLLRSEQYGVPQDTRDVLLIILSTTLAIAVGGMALAHTYHISTYLTLGLNTAAASIFIAHPIVDARRVSLDLFGRLMAVSICFVVGVRALAQFMVKW